MGHRTRTADPSASGWHRPRRATRTHPIPLATRIARGFLWLSVLVGLEQGASFFNPSLPEPPEPPSPQRTEAVQPGGAPISALGAQALAAALSFVQPARARAASPAALQPGDRSAAEPPANGAWSVAIPPVRLDGSRMPAGPIPAVYYRPPGDGPVPAVILLHGCNGPFAAPPAWVPRLMGWGYAVLLPDSTTPRGLTSVCELSMQPLLTPRDRVGDVASASVWLRRQPGIDHARIAVLGLSHGGAVAAHAAQYPYAAMGLRAAIDYYGPCGLPGALGATPLLALAGEADDWGDPAPQCRRFGAQVRPGQTFELHTYPGVYHAFDFEGARKVALGGHFFGYDQAAAEDSFLRVHSFLDRWVGR